MGVYPFFKHFRRKVEVTEAFHTNRISVSYRVSSKTVRAQTLVVCGFAFLTYTPHDLIAFAIVTLERHVSMLSLLRENHSIF